MQKLKSDFNMKKVAENYPQLIEHYINQINNLKSKGEYRDLQLNWILRDYVMDYMKYLDSE